MMGDGIFDVAQFVERSRMPNTEILKPISSFSEETGENARGGSSKNVRTALHFAAPVGRR
jgi:hypothetical protein